MDRTSLLLSVAICLLALSCHTYARTSPPKITKQSDPLYVVLPKVPTEIVCEATGTPEPTYRWQKDGVDLVMERPFSLNGGNLAVSRPTEMTNGTYRCFASNLLGVAISNKIVFGVAFLDSFIETDKTTFTFDEGQLASIPCGNQASMPKPSVFWTDDANPGNEIVLDNRVSIDPKFNLRFSNIKMSDTGNYQCNVKNDKLRTQHLSPIKEIVVKKVDNIQTRPATLVYTPASSVNAFRTQSLRLKCMAEGYPTPSISWEKEGEALPANRTTYESFNQELVISDVNVNDAGSYICRASNGDGEPTSFSTTVIVQSTPYWKNKPEDINMVIEGSGELACEAGGIPLPTVTWLVNGVPSNEIEVNPRVTITEGQGGGRVEYANAQTEDSAVYLCMAVNEHGEISASGFVNVESIPAELTSAPALSIVTITGKGFELICSGQGSPKPVVTWYFKNAKIISDGSRYDIVDNGNSARTTSTLTVKAVTVEDSGSYVCSISNGFGAVNGSSRVTVRKATTVNVSEEVFVKKDEDAIVACAVDHDDALPPTVSWFRDVGAGEEELDLTVPGGRFRHAKTGTNNLKVLQTVTEDTGTYECRAVTSEDEASASAELVVQTVPAAPSGLVVERRSDDSDTMASLTWNSGDDGHSSITEYIVSYETNWPDLGWLPYSSVPASSSQVSLDLSPWVTYRFRVVAVNAIGNSEPSQLSADYTTEAAPITEAPKEVGIKATDPGVMEVTWPEVHPIDQNGPGFKYVVRWKEPGAGDDEWEYEEITDYRTTSYEIDTGDIYKELEVEVMYENDLGKGPSIEQSGFTGEGTPKDAPQNVKVQPEGPMSVNITWDPIPASSVNGQLQSFQIYYTMVEIQAQGQDPAVCLPVTVCRVGELSPFQAYEFQVAVKNGQREGPKSDPVTITMPEGEAGEVFNLQVTPLSDRIHLSWKEPASPNGVITGYNLSYNTFDGDTLGATTEVTISDPTINNHTVNPAEPDTDYRIVVFAVNGAGKGKALTSEVKTRDGGVPVKPVLVDGQIDPGKEYINVTFVQSENGAAANQFYVQYKEADDDTADFMQTKPMDVLDSDMITVSGLKSSTEYTLKIVAVNDDGETAGQEEMAKTLGSDAQVAAPIYVQGWFIILLIIIVALLCILLVLCILKSQRGGKYNVSDKEQQRKGDIESTPLKDEGGFEEFEPRKDNPDGDLPRGSQGSLRDSEPGSSDTDSLKEYADGELGKFNEEGSFIGQYGDKKQRPTEDGEQGGAAYSTFV